MNRQSFDLITDENTTGNTYVLSTVVGAMCVYALYNLTDMTKDSMAQQYSSPAISAKCEQRIKLQQNRSMFCRPLCFYHMDTGCTYFSFLTLGSL